MKKILYFLVFSILSGTSFSQSLESQLQSCYGDITDIASIKKLRLKPRILTASSITLKRLDSLKSDPCLVVSGDTLTSLRPGYQWMNPTDPRNFMVLPVQTEPSLDPYKLKKMETKFQVGTNTNRTGLLFTYTWYHDSNNDGKMQFNEFANITPTFRMGELINEAFEYCCINRLDGPYGSLKMYDAENDLLLAVQKLHMNLNGSIIFTSEIGNDLPSGKYYITATLFQKKEFIFREYFEVVQ